MKTKFILFFVLLSSVLIANSQGSDGQAKAAEWIAPKEADGINNPIANDQKTIEKGKRIYNQICATCHGRSGKGDGPTGLTLVTKPADHTSAAVQNQSDGAIFYKISKGRDLMPSYNTALSKTQRWQVIRYLRTLNSEEK